MRQSDPTSNARLRKSEREQGLGLGQGQGETGREYQTIKVEVDPSSSPGGKGPPSTHSGGRSRRSRGSGDFSDMPTGNDIDDGFAFPVDKDES
jgi:hypothetical protein